MYHITYQFNETAIVTVVAIEFHTAATADKCVSLIFTDKRETTHAINIRDLISILPVQSKRKH